MLINVRNYHRGRYVRRLVHAHVEWCVGTKGEPSRWIIKLWRRDAQIHQDAYDRFALYEVPFFFENRRYIGERSRHDSDAFSKIGQLRRRRVTGNPITINSQESNIVRVFQNPFGVSAAAQRGVNHHANGQAAEKLDNAALEHRSVVEILGHSQPYDRLRRAVTRRIHGEEGGGGFLPRAGRKAAHGPGFVGKVT